MKCYYHNDRDGVGQCNHCGKVLCKECMDIYSPPLCTECAGVRNNTNKLNATAQIILGIVAMVFGGFMYLVINDSMEVPKFLMYLIMWGGVPYGWSALNKITPSFFLILPVVGWIIYFVIKLAIAMYFGWILLLIKVIKNVYTLAKSKKMDNYINQQNQQ